MYGQLIRMRLPVPVAALRPLVPLGLMSRATRGITFLLSVGLLLIGSGTGAGVSAAGPWQESRFQTGCDPGPYNTPPPPEHLQTHYPTLDPSSQAVALNVDLSSPTQDRGGPILGTGFNFEHALWSCPEFRGLLRSEILDPFMPSIARVDTGLLPAAPPQLAAQELGPNVTNPSCHRRLTPTAGGSSAGSIALG